MDYGRWLVWREEYFEKKGVAMGKGRDKPKREKKKPKKEKKKMTELVRQRTAWSSFSGLKNL